MPASIYQKCQQKVDLWLPGARWGGEEQVEKKWGGTTNRYGFSYWSDKNFLKLIVVMAVQLCEGIKNHRMVYLCGIQITSQ